jgi:hypothetical protein
MTVGMSSRLSQAYVATKLCHFERPTTKARHSEATAACSTAGLVENQSQIEPRMSRSSSLPKFLSASY